MPNSSIRIAPNGASLDKPPFAPVLPDTGFLREPQVLAFVPISKSTLWRRVRARTFPVPVKLSTRVTAWKAEDIRQWIAAQSGVPS